MYPGEDKSESWLTFLFNQRRDLHTLLFIDTQHDDYLIAPNTDKLLNATNTSSREFGEQNHAVDVVVFEQLHVRTHLGDLESNDGNELACILRTPKGIDNCDTPASH